MDARPDQHSHDDPAVAPSGRSNERPPDTSTHTADTTTDRPTEAVVYRGAGIMWSGIAVIVVMALLVVVAFQNTQDVTFDFLWLDTSIPLILILAITFGIAVVTTETIGFVWRRRRRKQRRDRNELRRLRRGAG